MTDFTPRRESKLSLVPLSPTTDFFPRTLPQSSRSPSLYESSLSHFPIKSPNSPPRPARPDAPTSTFNPGWSGPFPSIQRPKRPERPEHPDQALMFDVPLDDHKMSEESPLHDSVREVEERLVQFPAPVWRETGSGVNYQYSISARSLSPYFSEDDPEEIVDLATLIKTEGLHHSTYRKPVPPFLPVPIPTPLRSITPTSRLSLSAFEAQLDLGRSTSRTPTPTPAPLPPVPPLPTRPPTMMSEVARGKRRERVVGGDLDRRRDGGVFSPRFGLGLAEGGRDARKERKARDAVYLGNDGVLLPRLPDDTDVRDTQSPHSDRTIRQDERSPHKFSSTPSSTSIGTKIVAQQRRSDGTPLPLRGNGDEVEVVVTPTGEWQNERDGHEDEEEDRRKIALRDGRMDFDLVDYKGWFPKVVHLLYPLFFFAHFPATLFIDYNVLYTLAQLAISPTLPSTLPPNSPSLSLNSRAIAVPTLHPSTAYWVALAVYALSTIVWGLGICLWRDFLRGYLKVWGGRGKVHIGRVYSGSASFGYACLKSYSYFSFLYRVRLAPFRKTDPVRDAVLDTTALDGWCETFAWYSQNWPTVLLLIPRAGLSLAILLLYGTAAYGNPYEPLSTRDTAYFRPTGVLTRYTSAVLLTNCVWAAYRILLVVVSFLGLAVLSPYTRAIPTSMKDSKRGRKYDDWKTRRGRRLKAAMLLAMPGERQESSRSAFRGASTAPLDGLAGIIPFADVHN